MKFLAEYIKRRVHIQVHSILFPMMREVADKVYKESGIHNYYQDNSKLRGEVNSVLYQVRKHLEV